MTTHSPLIPAKAGTRFATHILICIFAIVAALSNMTQAAAEADEAIKPQTPPRPGVWFPTECPDSVAGAGSDPSDPILIEDHDDILISAKFWGSSAEEQRRLRSYFDEGEDPPLDLNCRFVRIAGHFRHRPYHDYRGVLASSARDLYLNGGPGNFIREGIYFIESWADAATSSILLNGADITIVGQYYDLCRAARQAEAETGDFLIVMGGPCHYGDFTGQMLRDVAIVETKNQFQRIRGEANRTTIGDLEKLPPSWPDFENVRRTARSWVAAVRSGAESYYRAEYAPGRSPSGEKTRTEFLKRSLEDHDDWIWFLADAAASPVARLRPRLENQQFAIFEIASYRGGVNRWGVNAVDACFCTRRTCNDRWPLRHDDAEYFFDDYVCKEFRRDRDDPTKWK
ncbi:MAG: hypothetical protein ACOZAA_07545 [Pseudomonadota bacterium]